MAGSRKRTLNRTLRETFGHDGLRPGQREVIEHVLAGEDTLAIMPTGAGKSLCYQLPGLHLEGTTLVVSPLIALMKDQADKLQSRGVAAAALNSTLAAAEEELEIAAVEEGRTEMVFTTPERLANPEFIESLQQQPIDILVIDEAHCISQWGHDFRPAYLELGEAAARLGNPPILALTATAPPDVAEDIRLQLGRPAMRVIDVGIYRPNLHLEVRQVTHAAEKDAVLLDLLRGARGSGIVYVATVKAAEQVGARLSSAGLGVLVYHGRLPDAERERRQDAFMKGEVPLMVATNAFGMGIDNADIRFVIHYQIPGSLEAYYQEAGRAGRDGRDATCTLLYDHADRRIQQYFLGGRAPTAADFRAVLENGGEGLPKGRVRLVRALLRQAGLGRASQADAAALEKLARAYREKQGSNRRKLEQVTAYAHSAQCRWTGLLEYFGIAPDFEGCGSCDNCRHPPPTVEAPKRTRAKPRARWTPQPGEEVSVRRFGRGLIQSCRDDSVTVAFADGTTREFRRDFVTRPRKRTPQVAAGATDSPEPAPAAG